MRINRHNYEEFFILYLDKELDDTDRRMVESFISLHPDLEEELELLSQFRLQPDMSIGFPSKEILLKQEGQREISTEELLLHLDGELDGEQSRKLQEAIDNNDHLQQEFSWLRKTQLPAEEIPFPGKSILYRQPGKRVPVFTLRAYRVAAAVILLLLAGALFILLNNRQQNSEGPELVNTGSPSPGKTRVIPVQQKESPLAREELKTSLPEKPAVDVRNYTTEKPLVKNVNGRQKPGQALVTPERSNDLPEPLHNREAIALNKNRNPQTIDPETNFDNESVTSLSPHPSQNIRRASATEVIDDPEQEPAGGKKNKLRGLFRKVTRTFEKRTNIDATDNEERLLVAGLSIKLK